MRGVFYILILLLFVASCGSDKPVVEDAKTMILANDYEAAQRICDKIIDDVDLTQLSVDDLCELSIIYAKLSEQHSQEDNMAKAIKCYRVARDINADSVEISFRG